MSDTEAVTVWRNPVDGPVLCSQGCGRTTFSHSGACYCCVALPMPTWHDPDDAA